MKRIYLGGLLVVMCLMLPLASRAAGRLSVEDSSPYITKLRANAPQSLTYAQSRQARMDAYREEYYGSVPVQRLSSAFYLAANGKVYKYPDLRGGAVVSELWETDCGACGVEPVYETPASNARRNPRDRQPPVFKGIVMHENALDRFADAQKIYHFPSVPQYDKNGTVVGLYKGPAGYQAPLISDKLNQYHPYNPW